jgi:phage FluMu protein gp41
MKKLILAALVNSLSCASDFTCTMAVREIPTTDIINANAATKLVIVTSLPHLVQSFHCLAGNVIGCAKTVDDVIEDF